MLLLILSLVSFANEGLTFVNWRGFFHLDQVVEFLEFSFPFRSPQESIDRDRLKVLCVKIDSGLQVTLITGVARSIAVLEDGVLIVF